MPLCWSGAARKNPAVQRRQDRKLIGCHSLLSWLGVGWGVGCNLVPSHCLQMFPDVLKEVCLWGEQAGGCHLRKADIFCGWNPTWCHCCCLGWLAKPVVSKASPLCLSRLRMPLSEAKQMPSFLISLKGEVHNIGERLMFVLIKLVKLHPSLLCS